MKHLRVDQVRALIAAAGTDRNRLFLEVIYQHGLRVSEALALTRGSVKRGFLQVKPRKKGKRSDEKMDQDTLALWEKVTACLLPTTLVFPFSRQWASEIFHAAAAKVGIALPLRCGIHSLRHSCAHHLLDQERRCPSCSAFCDIGQSGVPVSTWSAMRATRTTGGRRPSMSARRRRLRSRIG